MDVWASRNVFCFLSLFNFQVFSLSLTFKWTDVFTNGPNEKPKSIWNVQASKHSEWRCKRVRVCVFVCMNLYYSLDRIYTASLQMNSHVVIGSIEAPTHAHPLTQAHIERVYYSCTRRFFLSLSFALYYTLLNWIVFLCSAFVHSFSNTK